MSYDSYRNQATQRTVEPYSIAGWWGRWYLISYCCPRQDYRQFRLHRMQQVQVLAETFVRAEDFDCETYVVAQLGPASTGLQIAVEFQAPLYAVQQKIPARLWHADGDGRRRPLSVLYRRRYLYGALSDGAQPAVCHS